MGQLRAGKVNLLEYFSFIRPQILFAESLAVLGCVCLTFKEHWERIELFKTYGKRTKDGHYKRQVLISRRLGAFKKKTFNKLTFCVSKMCQYLIHHETLSSVWIILPTGYLS